MMIIRQVIKKSLAAATFLVYGTIAIAQAPAAATPAPTPAPAAAPTFGIKWSGFVRNDMYYDTRQVTQAREGELLLYPKDISKDVNQKDVNANASVGFSAVMSRLTGTISGPDAFGAKTSGVLEVEFGGITNDVTGEVRVRHAYAKLDWAKTQLGFGQFWHPLFVPECFPGTVSYNTGIPFQPFARGTQVRLTSKLGTNLNLILVAIQQREVGFSSIGPTTAGYTLTPTQNSTFQQNAVVPNLHAQLQYKSANIVAGVAVDYKQLRPYLISPPVGTATLGTALDARASSTTLMAYAKFVTKPVVIKAEIVQGQNLTDMVGVGGYLQYGSGSGITFAPINTQQIWLDIMGTGKNVVPGLFIGYLKNQGASTDGATAAFARSTPIAGRGIDNVLRIAPRIEIPSGKWKFAGEIEYTATAYGVADAAKNGKVSGTLDNVNNTRILFQTVYSF